MAAARQAAPRHPRRAGGHVATLRFEGGGGVAELQRARMLHSVVQVVMERGYGQMSVARVTGRAGVSRRTFYEAFEGREACFLAAFDETVAEMRTLAVTAWERESVWQKQLRAALGGLLEFLDERPGVGSLLVVEALGAGPRVLAHRAQVLSELVSVVDRGRLHVKGASEPPALTAEGLVGAVLGVVHARLLQTPRVPLAELLNPLVQMIVAPYLGPRVAARELEYPALARTPGRSSGIQDEPFRNLNMRVTYRTVLVLSVISQQPGVSNREVADRAGVSDQGQISKLLSRLEGLGLIQNTTQGELTGEPNRWQLTARGQEIQETIDLHAKPTSPTIATGTR